MSYFKKVYVTNSKVKCIPEVPTQQRAGTFHAISVCLSHPTILTANRHAAKCFQRGWSVPIHVSVPQVRRSELIMILIPQQHNLPAN